MNISVRLRFESSSIASTVIIIRQRSSLDLAHFRFWLATQHSSSPFPAHPAVRGQHSAAATITDMISHLGRGIITARHCNGRRGPSTTPRRGRTRRSTPITARSLILRRDAAINSHGQHDPSGRTAFPTATDQSSLRQWTFRLEALPSHFAVSIRKMNPSGNEERALPSHSFQLNSTAPHLYLLRDSPQASPQRVSTIPDHDRRAPV
jgi:hypothetical protein